MLHALLYFRSLRISKSVQSANKISCYPADTLEFNTFTDFAIYILYLAYIHMTSVFLHNNSRHTRTGWIKDSVICLPQLDWTACLSALISAVRLLST